MDSASPSHNEILVRLLTGILLVIPRAVSLEPVRFGLVRFLQRTSRERESD